MRKCLLAQRSFALQYTRHAYRSLLTAWAKAGAYCLWRCWNVLLSASCSALASKHAFETPVHRKLGSRDPRRPHAALHTLATPGMRCIAARIVPLATTSWLQSCTQPMIAFNFAGSGVTLSCLALLPHFALLSLDRAGDLVRRHLHHK
jgi:hypothetical protein